MPYSLSNTASVKNKVPSLSQFGPQKVKWPLVAGHYGSWWLSLFTTKGSHSMASKIKESTMPRKKIGKATGTRALKTQHTPTWPSNTPLSSQTTLGDVRASIQFPTSCCSLLGLRVAYSQRTNCKSNRTYYNNNSNRLCQEPASCPNPTLPSLSTFLILDSVFWFSFFM